MGKLNILGPEGHTEVSWELRDTDTTDDVRRRFDDLVRSGFLTYRTDPATNESELIRTFDRFAQTITALRPIQGG
ncbi:MAG: hypothetical protein ACR2MC_13420 [Actinomycetota bacterium]